MSGTHSIPRILKQLRSLGSAENVAGMARFGITSTNSFGVPLEQLRVFARELGRDHAFALQLWETGNREARILAAFTADPKIMTRAEMDHWAVQFDSWDVCDACCIHLFRKSPLAWAQAVKWTRRKPEFARRAGFALIATLAVHDKKAPDETFQELFPLLEASATDDRNFVKKAVNWALRQIGKRNPALRVEALKVALRLAESELASARWIGKDAARELSASARTPRSSLPPGTTSKRTAQGRPGRSRTPMRRPNPD
ncbi:MAG: DNA alkylation repair protein [Acidobacteriota bacterium]